MGESSGGSDEDWFPIDYGDSDGGGSGDEGAPGAESDNSVWEYSTSERKRTYKSKYSGGGRGRIGNTDDSEKVRVRVFPC